MKITIDIELCYSQGISEKYKCPGESFLLSAHYEPTNVITLDDEIIHPMRRHVDEDWNKDSKARECESDKDRKEEIQNELSRIECTIKEWYEKTEEKMERKEDEGFRDFVARVTRAKKTYDVRVKSLREKKHKLENELKEIEGGEKHD